ncbi:DUF397 domain-containing protein [Streptomyces sp. DSM 41524]|uniref:DUF397 domain-containing protein n=1 Tax=Streptomyces asiaticus subsp. ignotus TaxID=3098222 RepID=A0ABU7PXR6_9ACTN|nr:DUF397 domain-containing protein [Streptomyces sp. DSM 41524]
MSSSTTGLKWFKSSYSGGGGGDCVEVAFTKSSYSGGGGGECVEVAIRPDTVHIRDSKDTERTPLTVSPEAWAAFIAHI